MVEVGERHDQPDVVALHELDQLRQVGRIVEPRHELVLVGMVESRCERVGVDGHRTPSRPAECTDDVDALARAGEEDDVVHGRSSPTPAAAVLESDPPCFTPRRG